MIDPSSQIEARHSAMNYLAIREHSSLELRNKLLRKGFEDAVINEIITQLQLDNLQSNERFAESYTRMRTGKGYGPLNIQQELQRRGIERNLLTTLVNTNDSSWVSIACQAREKRFGPNLPENKRELAKQVRFLETRGFTYSQIKVALSGKIL
jgi:regulatory protein